MESIKLKLCRGDMIVIIAVVLSAALLFTGLTLSKTKSDSLSAMIYLDGKLVSELPLNRDGQYTVTGSYTNTVTVKDGKVSVTYSDCPGGDCTHSGWVSGAGRSIVCLPNRMEVRIHGSSDIDAVTG